MAERSRPGRAVPSGFPLSRLIVGLVLVVLVGSGLAFGLARLRDGPDAGRLVYAARQGIFSHDLASGDDEKLADLPDDVEAAMPSPDGRYVGYAKGGGALWLLDVTNGEEFQVSERFTVPLGWSPDNRLIAGELLSDQDLVSVDPDGAREVLLSGGYAAGSPPVFIDADRFAISADETSFLIVDGSDASDPIEGTPLAASADGSELLISRGKTVVVAKVGDGDVTEVRRIFSQEPSFAAASPAGFVAISAKDGVHVFEGGTKSRPVLEGSVDWLGWARSGAVLLYAKDGAAYAIELTEDGDSKPERITREGSDVLPVLAFSVISSDG